MPTQDSTELLVNERDTQKGLLVSVCDADVMGETFENGKVSLTVDEDFYDGETADEEAVVQSLSRCSVANLVGTRAVGLAIDHGFVDEENVLDFEGTRHAQLLWM
jgi:hypothetical protein